MILAPTKKITTKDALGNGSGKYHVLARLGDFLLFHDLNDHYLGVFEIPSQKTLPKKIPIKISYVCYWGNQSICLVGKIKLDNIVVAQLSSKGNLEIISNKRSISDVANQIIILSERTPLPRGISKNNIMQAAQYTLVPSKIYTNAGIYPIWSVYCPIYHRRYSVYYLKVKLKFFILVFNEEGTCLGFFNDLGRLQINKGSLRVAIRGRYLYTADSCCIRTFDFADLDQLPEQTNDQTTILEIVSTIEVRASYCVYFRFADPPEMEEAVFSHDEILIKGHHWVFSSPYVEVSQHLYPYLPARLQQEIFIGLLLARRPPMNALPREIVWYILTWLV